MDIKRTVGMLLGVFMVLSMVACGKESYRIVKLTEMTGTVTYTRDEATEAVYENMNFENGDSVVTASESSAKLSLDSDKFLTMGANTSIQMMAEGDDIDSQTTITLNSGEISCEIQNTLSENSMYEVKTSNATIGVHGTVFYVKAEADRTIVYCENGEVEVTSGTQSLTLLPTEAVVVEDGNITVTPIEDILEEVSDVVATVLTELMLAKEELLTVEDGSTDAATGSDDIEVPEGATLDLLDDGTYYIRYADGGYEYYSYGELLVDEFKLGSYDGTEYWIRTTYYHLSNGVRVPSMRTYFDTEYRAQVFRFDYVYETIDETHYSARKYVTHDLTGSSEPVGEAVSIEYTKDADDNWVANFSDGSEDFWE